MTFRPRHFQRHNRHKRGIRVILAFGLGDRSLFAKSILSQRDKKGVQSKTRPSDMESTGGSENATRTLVPLPRLHWSTDQYTCNVSKTTDIRLQYQVPSMAMI